MRIARMAGAVICLLVGLLWIGQGLGLIGGSVMTGKPQWSAAGLAVLAIAIWQLWLLARSAKT